MGTVYGPGDLSDHFIPTIIRRMRKKNLFKVYGTGKRADFIYVDDQVKGIFMSKDYNEKFEYWHRKTNHHKKIIQISKN